MNLIDSSAWLAYFNGEKNRVHFREPIKDFIHLIVPTIVIYEVFKRMLATCGSDSALEASAHLQRARVIPLTDHLAILAAKISREEKLGMADSIILATARTYSATIWTQDADFKGVAGVKYFKK
ncbi:MAG: type II toxin-antitoxin system VapC family toxin [Candidatus Peregrinibacteria bacterium]